MSAVTSLPLRPDGWTVDDLELLPDHPPFRLWTYRLDGDVSRETGRWSDEVDVAEPVPLRLRLEDLVT